MEDTFVLIKPDGIQRSMVGRIIQRLEEKGLQLRAMKMVWLDKEIVEELYPHLKEREFFPRLANFMISSPVLAMVWRGEGAVAATRKLLGSTDPQKAENGTIRGDLALAVGANLVHCSDSEENAAREIELFFSPEEMWDYEKSTEIWLREEPWQ